MDLLTLHHHQPVLALALASHTADEGDHYPADVVPPPPPDDGFLQF